MQYLPHNNQTSLGREIDTLPCNGIPMHQKHTSTHTNNIYLTVLNERQSEDDKPVNLFQDGHASVFVKTIWRLIQ